MEAEEGGSENVVAFACGLMGLVRSMGQASLLSAWGLVFVRDPSGRAAGPQPGFQSDHAAGSSRRLRLLTVHLDHHQLQRAEGRQTCLHGKFQGSASWDDESHIMASFATGRASSF